MDDKRELMEKLLNMVITKKYNLVDSIKVITDTEFDYPTYVIYVVTKKYNAIKDEDSIVKDIKSVLKSVGINKRDIENIIFSMYVS